MAMECFVYRDVSMLFLFWNDDTVANEDTFYNTQQDNGGIAYVGGWEGKKRMGGKERVASESS